jgi:uncharacterized membrane protein YidH (DUF202 family)
LAIIVAGVAFTAYTVPASQSSFVPPNPEDPEASAIEVKTRVSRNPGTGIVALLVGTLVNFYAISKYRSEHSEIRRKEPRPEGMFLVLGVLVTLAAFALGAYIIFVRSL